LLEEKLANLDIVPREPASPELMTRSGSAQRGQTG
jgi:hypothetical protein